jgi:hypothetical protein
VKVSFGIGKQFTVWKRAEAVESSDLEPDDATGPGGGPDVGDRSRPPTGSTSAQGPHEPESDAPSTRGRVVPPPPNKPPSNLPVESGDGGAPRTDQ